MQPLPVNTKVMFKSAPNVQRAVRFDKGTADDARCFIEASSWYFGSVCQPGTPRESHVRPDPLNTPGHIKEEYRVPDAGDAAHKYTLDASAPYKSHHLVVQPQFVRPCVTCPSDPDAEHEALVRSIPAARPGDRVYIEASTDPDRGTFYADALFLGRVPHKGLGHPLLMAPGPDDEVPEMVSVVCIIGTHMRAAMRAYGLPPDLTRDYMAGTPHAAAGVWYAIGTTPMFTTDLLYGTPRWPEQPAPTPAGLAALMDVLDAHEHSPYTIVSQPPAPAGPPVFAAKTPTPPVTPTKQRNSSTTRQPEARAASTPKQKRARSSDVYEAAVAANEDESDTEVSIAASPPAPAAASLELEPLPCPFPPSQPSSSSADAEVAQVVHGFEAAMDRLRAYANGVASAEQMRAHAAGLEATVREMERARDEAVAAHAAEIKALKKAHKQQVEDAARVACEEMMARMQSFMMGGGAPSKKHHRPAPEAAAPDEPPAKKHRNGKAAPAACNS